MVNEEVRRAQALRLLKGNVCWKETLDSLPL